MLAPSKTSSTPKAAARGPSAAGEHAPSDELHEQIQNWIAQMKRLLPPNSPVAAIIRESSKNVFQASFRARTGGKTIVAVANSYDPERAVREAGETLVRRLGSTRKRKIALRRKLKLIMAA